MGLELIEARFRKGKCGRPLKVCLDTRNTGPLDLTTALPVYDRHLEFFPFFHYHGRWGHFQEGRIMNEISVQLAGGIGPQHWKKLVIIPTHKAAENVTNVTFVA